MKRGAGPAARLDAAAAEAAARRFISQAEQPSLLEPGEPFFDLKTGEYELAWRAGRLWIEAWNEGRNLARDGRFAFCVDQDQPPYAFVMLQGRTETSEDPEETLRWAGRLGARYMGEERAPEYAARNGGAGNLLVRAHIEKVIAFAGIAD